MPSRDDVARLAGVSGATVSYVLNNTPGISISEPTKKAVFEAARKLGYRPSLAAKSLVSGRYHQIGVLGPAGQTLFSPYHEHLLQGIWKAATEHGYRLVIDSVRQDGEISFLSEIFVDGLIALAPTPDSFAKYMKGNRFPDISVVMIGAGSWASSFTTVDIDNRLLGRAAAKKIWDAGHRSAIFFGGVPESNSVKLRRQGFVEFMADMGMKVSDDHIIDCMPETASAHETAVNLLEKNRDFTAAFCFNDNTALGLIQAAREVGVSIPEDLSILGVDARETRPLIGISLNSFRQPLEEMGGTAFELVIKSSEGVEHRIFDFEYVSGDTLVAPREE